MILKSINGLAKKMSYDSSKKIPEWNPAITAIRFNGKTRCFPRIDFCKQPAVTGTEYVIVANS